MSSFKLKTTNIRFLFSLYIFIKIIHFRIEVVDSFKKLTKNLIKLRKICV